MVILDLEIQDQQCRKIVGKFGQETILGISFKISSMENRGKLKWNPD